MLVGTGSPTVAICGWPAPRGQRASHTSPQATPWNEIKGSPPPGRRITGASLTGNLSVSRRVASPQNSPLNRYTHAAPASGGRSELSSPSVVSVEGDLSRHSRPEGSHASAPWARFDCQFGLPRRHRRTAVSPRCSRLFYLALMAPMPQPGDRYAQAFTVEPGQCWAMVHDRQGQATYCSEAPSCTGRWFSPRGDRWWRVWACPDHVDGLTGLREFGRRR